MSPTCSNLRVRKSLLLIDSAHQSLAGLRETLHDEGYGVTAVSTGDQPLESFSALQPDMVLIHLSAPDALKICDGIRNDIDGAIVPIVLLGSQHPDVQSPGDALAHGADYFFGDPLDLDKILAKVQTYIGEASPKEDDAPKANLSQKNEEIPSPEAMDDFGTQAGVSSPYQHFEDELTDPSSPNPLLQEHAPLAGADISEMPEPLRGESAIEGASDELLALIGKADAEDEALKQEEVQRVEAEKELRQLEEKRAEEERERTEEAAERAFVEEQERLAEEAASKERQRVAEAVAKQKAEAEIQRIREEREAQEAEREAQHAARQAAEAELQALKAAADATREAAEEEARLRAEAEIEKQRQAREAARAQEKLELERAKLEAERLRLEEEKEKTALLKAEAEAAAIAKIEAEAKAEAEEQARLEVERLRRDSEERALLEKERQRQQAQAEAEDAAQKEVERRKQVVEEEERRELVRRRVVAEERAKAEAEARLEAQLQKKEIEDRLRAEARERAEQERANALAKAENPHNPEVKGFDVEAFLAKSAKDRVETENESGPDHELEQHPADPRPEAEPEPKLGTPKNSLKVGLAPRGAAPALHPYAPASGEFGKDLDISALLVDVWRQRVTGRIDFRHDHRQKTIFFERGTPVDAYSSQVFDRMEEFLYREGKITRSQYQAVRVKGLRGPRRIGAYLVSEEFIKPQELFESVRSHLCDVVYGVFEWEEGRFEYHSDHIEEDDRVTLQRTTPAMVIEGIRRKYLLPRLMKLVGAPSSLLGPGQVSTLDFEQLGFSVDERQVVRLMDGTRNIEDLVFCTGLTADRVYQVLAALLALGAGTVLVRGVEGLSDEAQSNYDRIDRARILEKRDSVRQFDYFQILGVGRSATRYEIERAYERVCQEFSSRQFSEGLRAEQYDALLEIERVLEDAYEVLRDDMTRTSYARHL